MEVRPRANCSIKMTSDRIAKCWSDQEGGADGVAVRRRDPERRRVKSAQSRPGQRRADGRARG